MQSPERYCAYVSDVTCETCPLRQFIEEDWQAAVQEGATPFDLGDSLASAFFNGKEAMAETAQFLEKEARRGEKEYDEALAQECGRNDIRSRIQDTLNTTLRPEWPTNMMEARGAEQQPSDLVWQALGKCADMQMATTCVPPTPTLVGTKYVPEPLSPFAGIIDRSLGADTLQTIARHGNIEEVGAMVEKLLPILSQATKRDYIDASSLGEEEKRDFLMTLAEFLGDGRFSF